MRLPVTIDVTEVDITLGIKESCGNCPIALAGCRAARSSVTVGARSMSFRGENYWLPNEAITFIRLFDHGQPVKPFSFQLTRIVGEGVHCAAL